VTVIQNIYTGFDTEYELSDYSKSINKLISTQMAVQTRTMIKLPLYKPFDISFVHPLTSEISNFYKPDVDVWTPPQLLVVDWDKEAAKGIKCDELKILNSRLKHCTVKIREALYSTFYKLNESLIEGLRKIGGRSLYYVDSRRDKIVLALPETDERTLVNYHLLEYSFKNLVEDTKGLCFDDLRGG